jgi:16S rRNA (cytosine1402-N4)-methyltransferase
MYHTPVLLNEVLTQLAPRSGGLYVDGTLGGGGHAAAVLEASAPEGRLIGLDWDEEAISAARERLKTYGARAVVVPACFAELEEVLMRVGATAVDGVMFDLGVSSRQFDEPSRGFSFQQDGPLDMRMSRSLQASARDVLQMASVDELIRIFTEYGEERRARAIARVIERERQVQPIETTFQLVRLVERVLGPKRGPTHPATRVFQALRIHVNCELENLERGLEAAVRALKSGGRLAVISFHSLEDRMVKQFFGRLSATCVCPPGLPKCVCGKQPVLRVLTRKPITATDEEVTRNPRARSAKLRVAEKI